MEKKRRGFAVISIILNLLVLAATCVGLYFAFTYEDPYTGKILGLVQLKYFTIDSNVLLAVASFAMIIVSIITANVSSWMW